MQATTTTTTNNAGPTCQLCDNTGHAARSCPTHLNEVAANRLLLRTLDSLEASNKEQKQRLATLDDQVKELIKVVDRAIKNTDEEGLNDEFWEEHKENQRKAKPVAYGNTRTTGCSYAEMY